MDYLHNDFTLQKGQVVQVSLNRQANVLLMSDMDYLNYRSGGTYNYYGGLAKLTVVNIPVPHAGHWNLVIDMGGGSGSIRTGIRILN